MSGSGHKERHRHRHIDTKETKNLGEETKASAHPQKKKTSKPRNTRSQSLPSNKRMLWTLAVSLCLATKERYGHSQSVCAKQQKNVMLQTDPKHRHRHRYRHWHTARKQGEDFSAHSKETRRRFSQTQRGKPPRMMSRHINKTRTHTARKQELHTGTRLFVNRKQPSKHGSKSQSEHARAHSKTEEYTHKESSYSRESENPWMIQRQIQQTPRNYLQEHKKHMKETLEQTHRSKCARHIHGAYTTTEEVAPDKLFIYVYNYI